MFCTNHRSESRLGTNLLKPTFRGTSRFLHRWLSGAILQMAAFLLTAPTLFGQGSAPYAFTRPATRVAGSSAVLNGMAVPNGLATLAWFEWGTNDTSHMFT